MNRAKAGIHHAEQAADCREHSRHSRQQGPAGVREYLCDPAPVGGYSSRPTVSNDSYTLVVVPFTLLTGDVGARTRAQTSGVAPGRAAPGTPKVNGMGWLRKLERLLMIIGVLMLVLYGASRIDQTVLSGAELQRFKAQQPASAGAHAMPLPSGTPDFTLWAEQRIKGYQESLAAHFPPAIAILRIPKIHVEVPVLEGTDDLTLNRGVGHVADTAYPGENGNMAIAGHRDGFFRGLKDIALGDTLEMVTSGRTETYVIDRIVIVDPSDVSVLQPRVHASLTLITCYPFYFVGSAPKRYIVQASVADPAPANAHAGGQTQSKPTTFDRQTQDEVFRTDRS
jgi:sortase A